MTKVEREQLVELFWKVRDILVTTQPDIGPAIEREGVDTSDLKIKHIDDMIDMLRLNVLYCMFDLEACRRDIVKLHGIIQSGGITDDEGSA